MNAPEDDDSGTRPVEEDENDISPDSSGEELSKSVAAVSCYSSNYVEEEAENEEVLQDSGLRKETDVVGYSMEVVSSEHSVSESKGGVRVNTVAGHAVADNVQPLPSVGIINEGCTCYLNSLLQLLFHLGYFRSAVYLMPVKDGECSIPQALQEIFFHMQVDKKAANIRKLTTAFNWGESQLFAQHDIQEMATLLRDNLEEKMKGTKAGGTINQLFQGCGKQVVATIDRTFISPSRDIFYDIHLPLGSNSTLIESLRSLTAKELLVGDNKYRVEEPGKDPEYKDAEKSYTFCRFPPVIWFHLKRFEMNLMSPSLEMKKINSRLEFPVELSLEEFEEGSTNRRDSTGGNRNISSCGSDRRGGSRKASEEKSNEEDDKSERGRAEEDLEQEQREKQRGKKQSKIKDENKDEEGEGEKEEEEKMMKNKKKEDNSYNPNGEKESFSTDSPPIYDLQGVIVHRGSVRSGHYYCYIREWDPVQARFTRWIEYDDDRVQVVPEELAVSTNFGGPLMRHGRPCNVLSTNNAYMLSYVRRADCPKVLAPSPLEIVSQRVKDVFCREKSETLRREEEEQQRSRRLTIFIITDEVIREYVSRYQRETFPRDERLSSLDAIRLEVQKTDTVLHVYNLLASCKKLHTLTLYPLNFRLWRVTSVRSGRFLRPIDISTSGNSDFMRDHLDNTVEDRGNATSIYVYLQQVSTFLLSSFDMERILREKKYVDTVVAYPCTLFLSHPIQVDEVTLHLDHTKGASNKVVVKVVLCDMDNQRITSEHKFSICERKTIRVNSESKLIRSVECSVKVSPREMNPVISYVQVTILHPSFSGQRPKHRFGEPESSAMFLEGMLVFLKYFNCNTCRLVYAGSVLLPRTATVKECKDILLYLLREDNVSSTSLIMFKEDLGSTRLLHDNTQIVNADVTFGAVLIGQQKDASLVSRFPTVDSYLNGISRIVPVSFIHICFSTADPSRMDTHDTNLSTAMLPAASVVSAAGVKEAGRGGSDDDCSAGEFFSCNDGGTVGHSSPVEVVYSSTNVGAETFHDSFYPERCFHVVMSYKCKIDIYWGYEDICERIGNASGYDPNFIRLYRKCVNSGDRTAPEADPAPSPPFRIELIRDQCNAVMFFEVLCEPRRVVDAHLGVIVTLRSAGDKPLYTERILLRENITYGDLVQGTLERCTEALRRAAVSTTKKESAAESPCGSSSSCGTGSSNSSGRNSNANEDNTVSTSPHTCGFSVGEHYLLLVMDTTWKTIKEILEISRGADGRWACDRRVGENISERGAFDTSSNIPSGFRYFHSSINAHVGTPLSLVLVPAAPLREEEWRLPCVHGEWPASGGNKRPLLFAQPFVVTIHTSTTVAEAREVLLAHTGVSPEEVEGGGYGLMIYADSVWCLYNWNENLLRLWTNTRNSSSRIPTLLLNHKRPREKPGSRYVAQNSPALSISK